jgi:hypothetical protein
MTKRKFIVELLKNGKSHGFIKYVYKNSIGVFYEITFKKEKAKIWRYKKNCQKSIDIIEKFLDPTKKSLKKYKYNIIEITESKELRKIKLKKLNKK